MAPVRPGGEEALQCGVLLQYKATFQIHRAPLPSELQVQGSGLQIQGSLGSADEVQGSASRVHGLGDQVREIRVYVMQSRAPRGPADLGTGRLCTAPAPHTICTAPQMYCPRGTLFRDILQHLLIDRGLFWQLPDLSRPVLDMIAAAVALLGPIRWHALPPAPLLPAGLRA